MTAPKTKSPSLAGRAFVALGLFVGFYTLALGIAAVLLYLPVGMVMHSNHIYLKVFIICWGAGGMILWALAPRIDKFTAPGPVIDLSKAPGFSQIVKDVASAARIPVPREIYLVPDLNAWVASRGGIMGIGSRRVMGIGLPLLHLLTVNQFKAVLAHEFGHYAGGEVSLGPWIYKTRAAIERTIGGLSESLLQKPFVWYGKAFLRITAIISRRQEFAADAFAARLVGCKPMKEGLQLVEKGAMAFPGYWQQEIHPGISAGYFVPIGENFRLFMASAEIQKAVSEALAASGTEIHGAYDSHPTFGERVAALDEMASELAEKGQRGGDAEVGSLARTLFDQDGMHLETSIRDWMSNAMGKRLEAVESEKAGTKIWSYHWGEMTKQFRSRIPGDSTPLAFPQFIKNRALFPSFASTKEGGGTPDEATSRDVISTLGALLGYSLYSNAWTIESPVGKPVLLRSGSHEVEPFKKVAALVNGETTDEAWRVWCEELGIHQHRLVPAA